MDGELGPNKNGFILFVAGSLAPNRTPKNKGEHSVLMSSASGSVVPDSKRKVEHSKWKSFVEHGSRVTF